MKKLLLLSTAAIMTLAATAQTEHIHVFRNDEQHHTVKASETQQITFGTDEKGTQVMNITATDGTVTQISMSAIDSCVVRPTALPEFHFFITDYPNWTELQGAKDDAHPGTMEMIGNGMFDDIPTMELVEFRGRGNSTWQMTKKPYRFKMSKKASICGLPKAKTFALIANYIDCTLMRNAIALWTAQHLGMPYTNHCVPVKVYFNGINKGQYMLTEKIGIGGGSVDIDETTGMLFELDSNYDEDYKFKYTWGSGWSQNTLPVMVKDPDIAELAADATVTNITDATAYFNLWKADFTKMADAVTSRSASESLSDVIDIESAVNFFFVNCLASNHEMQHPKSFYMHKKSLEDGEVYHFGPVWDFDWAFTFDGQEGQSATIPMVSSNGDYAGYSFIKLLCANQEFRTLFKAKLDAFVATGGGYDQLKAYIEEYAYLIEATARENGVLYPSSQHPGVGYVTREDSYNFRENLEILKTWIAQRVAYMQSHKNYGLYE
ncbi:MAG: CotH kinase family protein [Muribaculaceae bacterium]|nr:CotH kinase family protein [Muribaculaceae bacterium]